MNFATIRKGCMTIKNVVSKNSPAITAGIAVCAMGGAIWQAIRATRRLDYAMTKAHVKKNEAALKEGMDGKNDTKPVPLTATEKAIVFAKLYWPTAVLTIVAASCIVGSVCLANHQIKALAIMASTAESALDEYQKATVDVVGENKATAIHDQVQKNRIANNPPDETMIFRTGRGDTLCYDPLSGRYFYSDIDWIRSKINELNEDLLDQNFVSLNDYYEALDLEPVRYGSDQGWHYQTSGPYGSQIKVAYTSAKVTPDGKMTAFVIDVKTEPKFDYIDDLY